jgi:hypothetical protein
MNETGSTLIAGLRFSLLLGFRQRMAAGGAATFWLAVLLSVLGDILLNLLLVDAPREFFLDGLEGSALTVTKCLLLATFLSQMAQRPAWLWSIASWLVVMGLIMRAFILPVLAATPDFDSSWIVFGQPELVPAVAVWSFLASLRLWHWLEPSWDWVRVLAFAVFTALGFALPHMATTYSLEYIYGWGGDEETEEEVEAPPLLPDGQSIEDLFAVQDARVDQLLSTLQPQVPGQIDIYFVGVAAYASENVFANEVLYAQALFDQRFATRGRSLSLINHKQTLDTTPLATERNLRRSLQGIGKLIDAEEDIVFLFVSSHGSEEHELMIELAGLPLRQITPEIISSALSDAAISWHVSAISACYSGGYIPRLKSATSLVMTASRADRTSFGCGAESDITYFGRAYFAEALNASDDFITAFTAARRAIAAREEDQAIVASKPQIASGMRMAAKLAQWRSQHQVGEPLAFTPVFPASKSSVDAP